MKKIVKIHIDGRECLAEKGNHLIDVARQNRIFIPYLCNILGVEPAGSCRICTVKVNGRFMSACTTPVEDGMEVENDTDELNDIRKSIVEILFVEGNHFCPSCEKSGNCILQSLAYRYQIMVPRFPYSFPIRAIDASHPKIIKDHNRCVLCKRCIRAIKNDEGKSIFAFRSRGYRLEIGIDPELGDLLTDSMAQEAMDVCPVGSILRREQGFITPIGKRKYDTKPIGSDIEVNE
jgi:[NiFe] hydrogenase diaphorase moiety small subunit